MSLRDSLLRGSPVGAILTLVACGASTPSAGFDAQIAPSPDADPSPPGEGAGPTVEDAASDAQTSLSPAETGSGSSSGPLFSKYSPSGITADNTLYSSNGNMVSAIYYFYLANVGGAGTATVSVSYQGFTETNDFPVQAGVQYVLSTQVLPANGSSSTVTNCTLSVQLPGLAFVRNMASQPTLNDPIGKCIKVGGPTTSSLIPLASCSCSGGFNLDSHFRYTNCGISDPDCCLSCPSGKTCISGSCN